ncbi:prolyl 4-hydroxylase subunit alpha-1 [Trichonephila clavipes]|uniref:procollagen-proline 4-dioxygenase n=1 Tax=Trichonephila clavipes TaxID=2585209 RepID=A0A8X6VQT7_TRICX|nr:prolyl 4-hydroxylase subunit alpha-1 [Trichonephila clavipes]
MKVHVEVLLNIFIILSNVLFFTKAEVFTALVDLGPLLDTGGEIVKTLERYLKVEEERLEKVKWLRAQYEKLYTSAIQDEETFLSNPVNAYLLVKRLTSDWAITNRLIEGAQSKALIENITQQSFIFPDQEDLRGAASALLRLQDTYLLDTTQLARGEIDGIKRVFSELSAGDCFMLGHEALQLNDHFYTVRWMQEALDRLEREEVKTSNKQSILDYLAYSSFVLGDIEDAVKYTQHLLNIAPNHARAQENLIYYQNLLNNGDHSKGDEGSPSDDMPKPLKVIKREQIPTFTNYERLCRGEHIKTPFEQSQLNCRYTTSNNSYLVLQPVKVEQLSLDPEIVIFHDIISDKDMELFKDLAVPWLARATVQNPKSGALETASYRVSKSAWLNDTVHPRIARASQFIKCVTGLEVDTAEELHIINYGIGGHYEPHLDHKREGEVDPFAHIGTGNRIATWIFYLSDVEAGGATVFPKIGVQVKPKRGTAAFWYNLRKSGDGDMNTIHAACPVLSGTKWVGNKWLHEKNQEFRRRCSLNRWE